MVTAPGLLGTRRGKVSDILKVLRFVQQEAGKRGVTVMEIASGTGVPRRSCHQYLSVLCNQGRTRVLGIVQYPNRNTRGPPPYSSVCCWSPIKAVWAETFAVNESKRGNKEHQIEPSIYTARCGRSR